MYTCKNLILNIISTYCIPFVVQLLHVKSIAEARSKYKSVTTPILVGGKKHVVVRSSDISFIINSETTVSSDQDLIATCYQSMLINTHGINGTLY